MEQWSCLFVLSVLAVQVAVVCAQSNSPPRLPVDFPKFFSISEDSPIGTTLFGLQAVDANTNDVLRFRTMTEETSNLVDLGSPFKENGIWICNVTLREHLDRDQSPNIRKLYFGISDGSSEVNVNVILVISDVNDNPPTFVGLPYKTSIPEDFEVGVKFFTVTATDPDSNSGGSPVYTIEKNRKEFDEIFKIQPFFGTIELNKSLDYEERSFYHLKVSARDQGDPVCPGITCPCNSSLAQCEGEPVDLFITVEDVQDTPPVFERLLNMYYVPEDRLVGNSILQVQAVDGDRGVAVPNQIRYSLDNDDPTPFSIDKITGVVKVAEKLDVADPRSAGGLYILHITATEVPPPNSPSPNVTDPSLSTSQTNVSIIVTDVNDHAPQFNNATYTANVMENTPTGAPLTVTPTIVVSDKDQGENSRFRISVQKDGLPYNGFTTLPGEGQVIQGSSSVTITVGDTTVLDYETENTITFQLVLIEENPSGVTRVPSRPAATATVVLKLSDANDNSPVFPATQPRAFSVTEDTSPGHVIGTVTAEDADSGDFGTVTFTLEADGHEDVFNISSDGVIRLAKPLDREVRSSYSLVVVATDSPTSPPSQQRSSRLAVSVTVLDVNDLDPQWTLVIPVVSVQESAAPGTKVTDLIAVDLDQGLNGQIEYSIVPDTNGSSLFTVRKVDDRAEISVGRSLVGHSGLLVVKVKATDKGVPPRASETEISVLVIDENQFTPVFVNPDESLYNVSIGKLPEIIVDEEQPINTVLMTLQATDNDQGVNGEINYFLVPSLNKDFEFFTVDRETGNLRAARRLDREAKELYEIQVKAEDLGKPAARASTITLQVRLRDIDDHTPTFASQAMPIRMTVQEENNTANIGVMEASDADSESSNRGVCYYLYGGYFLNRLQLNKITGDLSLTAKIDRETTQAFDVVIKASARCDLDPLTFVTPQEIAESDVIPASRSVASAVATPPEAYNASDVSIAWVRVSVLDVNDNAPQFSHQELSTGILFDVPRDTEVMNLALQVTDTDMAANSKHLFRLVDAKAVLEDGDQISDSPQIAFTVSPNGTILTNTLFSSDLMGYFLLTVEVFDNDGLSDATSVRIYLISNLQRVKLIFNMKPNEVEKMKQAFVDALSTILKVDLVMDRVVSHTSSDGSKDASKSDAYLHGWYQDNGEMVPAAELRRSLDFNQEIRALLYKYDVVEAQTIEHASTESDSDELTRLFAIIIVVLGVFVVALILVLVHMVRMYKRRLKAATTMAYAAPKAQEMYEHPGTNKYYSAENPLYGREIKHAVIDDDKTSHNSLDVNAVDATHILPTSQKTTLAPSAPLPPLPPSSPPDLHPPTPQKEEQEVVMQISDLDPSTNSQSRYNSTATALTVPNGEAGSGYQPKSDNHIVNLDQVLQAYTNSAFQDDDEDEDEEKDVNKEEEAENSTDTAISNEINENYDISKDVANDANTNQKPNRRLSSNKVNGLSPPVRPVPGSGLYIPGVGDDVQEGVTRFSDEILSSDSGFPEGVDNGNIHRNYTDI